MEIQIGSVSIGEKYPVCFIADIGANFDGSLDRALMLIELAASAGANIVKFQSYDPKKIVSDYGFKILGKMSHQKDWNKTVVETWEDAKLPNEWIPQLASACVAKGVEFMSTPYSFEAVDALEPYVNAYKIGSGDIDYHDFLEYVARKKKPIILSTGASTLPEVRAAIKTILKINPYIPLVLMQCNTNYTGDVDNYKYLHLKVLDIYKTQWYCVLGVSDHTIDIDVITASVALGARVIERHFTDDYLRDGPDHRFACDTDDWGQMIEAAQRANAMLGNGMKRVEDNELETRYVQRRCLRVKDMVLEGGGIAEDNIEVLRPATWDSLPPAYFKYAVDKKAIRNIPAGDYLRMEDLEV